MTLELMTHDSLQEQHTSQHRHFEQRVQALFDLEYSRVYTSEPLRAPPHARCRSVLVASLGFAGGTLVVLALASYGARQSEQALPALPAPPGAPPYPPGSCGQPSRDHPRPPWCVESCLGRPTAFFTVHKSGSKPRVSNLGS